MDALDEQYLKTRQETDLWQSAQLADEAGTVKLEASIPPKEPTPDIPGGTRSEAELKSMGLDYGSIGRKERTVELPEVQAVRQQYQERLAKIRTGEVAVEEVGKVGRKLAE